MQDKWLLWRCFTIFCTADRGHYCWQGLHCAEVLNSSSVSDGSRVLCFPDKADPGSSGSLRRSPVLGAAPAIEKRNTGYPPALGEMRWGSEGRHFLAKLPIQALVQVTVELLVFLLACLQVPLRNPPRCPHLLAPSQREKVGRELPQLICGVRELWLGWGQDREGREVGRSQLWEFCTWQHYKPAAPGKVWLLLPPT